MTTNTTTATPEAPAMVCPICGKEFHDVITYADHLAAHSNEEKKRKADEEKKARENQRTKDVENLVELRANYLAAKKKFNEAVDNYESKYGLVFTLSDREKYDLPHLFELFHWL